MINPARLLVRLFFFSESKEFTIEVDSGLVIGGTDEPSPLVKESSVKNFVLEQNKFISCLFAGATTSPVPLSTYIRNLEVERPFLMSTGSTTISKPIIQSRTMIEIPRALATLLGYLWAMLTPTIPALPWSATRIARSVDTRELPRTICYRRNVLQLFWRNSCGTFRWRCQPAT